MRAYYKPRKAHPICLYLTADEANRLLDEMEPVALTNGNLLHFKVRRMLGRVVDDMEESTNGS